MKFEDLLLEVGGFGRFQMFTLLLLGVPRVILPFHFMVNLFMAAVPSHRCAIPDQDGFGNLTEEERLLISLPRQSDGAFSSCRMFSQPQWHLLGNTTMEVAYTMVSASHNASSWEAPTATVNTSSTVQSCQHGWVYDHSQFSSTIATQWDLVCEQKRLNQASLTFFFIGVTVGAVVIGYSSDRFGRRATLLMSCVFTLLFGMAAAASVTYPMLAVFRSLSGVSVAGFSLIPIALSVEWVDKKNRTKAGVLTSLCWSCGNMLLALVAYLIRDWRWLLVAASSPCVLGIISIWWLPESASWLLSKGEVKKAHALLVRCSSMNRRAPLSSKISTEVLAKIAEEENTGANYSYIDLLRTPVLRKMSICAGVVWFGVALSFYGISLNISGFGLDMYLTHFIYGAIEIPAKLGTYIFINKFGRRQAQAWTLLVTGFTIGINTVIPTSLNALRTTIAIIGKGFSEAAFTVLYLYTAELYPTVLRQNGMGYTSFIARIAVSVAPLILALDEVWTHLPQVIYCCVAIISGSIAFCLPETLNVRLPETVKDIEQKGWVKTIGTFEDPKEEVPLKTQEKKKPQ